MNYKFFVKAQIKSNKLSFIAAVAQMAVAMYLIIYLFAESTSFYAGTKLLKNFNSGDYFYVARTVSYVLETENKRDEYLDEYSELFSEYKASGMDTLSATDKAWAQCTADGMPDDNFREITKEDLEGMPYLEDVMYLSNINLSTSTDYEEETSVSTMSRAFCEKLNYKLKKGKWLDKAETDGSVIDAVVANNTKYKLNDVVPLYSYNTYYDENADDYVTDAVDTGISVRVIGILSYGEQAPALVSTNSSFDSSSFYDLISDYGENSFITVEEDFSKVAEKSGCNSDELSTHTYVITKLSVTPNDSQLEEINAYFAENRLSGVSMERLYSNTLELERNNSSNVFIPTFAAGIFSVFAIISISVFQMQYMRKKYLIYYYCGMEKGKEKFIQMSYIGRIILISAVLSVIAYIVIGFIGYLSKVNKALDNGFAEEIVHSWYSIGDFINITPSAVLTIIVFSGIIAMLSTIVCASAVKNIH